MELRQIYPQRGGTEFLSVTRINSNVHRGWTSRHRGWRRSLCRGSCAPTPSASLTSNCGIFSSNQKPICPIKLFRREFFAPLSERKITRPQGGKMNNFKDPINQTGPRTYYMRGPFAYIETDSHELYIDQTIEGELSITVDTLNATNVASLTVPDNAPQQSPSAKLLGANWVNTPTPPLPSPEKAEQCLRCHQFTLWPLDSSGKAFNCLTKTWGAFNDSQGYICPLCGQEEALRHVRQHLKNVPAQGELIK